MAHPVFKVHSTSEFEKSFRKLPVRIQELATKKDKWFRNDAFDPRLHTHKLKGELEGYWSYYINHLPYPISFPKWQRSSLLRHRDTQHPQIMGRLSFFKKILKNNVKMAALGYFL